MSARRAAKKTVADDRHAERRDDDHAK